MQKLFRSAIKLERFTIVPNSLLSFYLKCSTLLAPMTHMSHLCHCVPPANSNVQEPVLGRGSTPTLSTDAVEKSSSKRVFLSTSVEKG